jgi:Carboxypeptidase regulatory-like domain/TonB dependent receptor
MVSRRIASRELSETALLVCAVLALPLVLVSPCLAQTSSTGAIVGTSLDPVGAVVPVVDIRLTNLKTREILPSSSDRKGYFAFPLLPAGEYDLDASKVGYALIHRTGLHVNVTETLRLELHMQVETLKQHVEVHSDESFVQTDNIALGRVVDESAVRDLPLVNRNFTQIAGLSPGVIAGVNNAGELGLGDGALSQIAASNDGIFVHGSRSYDNNFQMDGISVSDVQGSSSASGGIPVPNPDTIQEFKVQTALYDASYGRYAGANLSIITRTGGNNFHGSAFEFLRNDILNANDFFRNETNQPRYTLKQNQFGFTFGGPLRKEKAFLFTSYQGTRQVNGIAAGQARIACSATLSTPPLTNDRSPAALSKLFAGMSGANGGIAVDADGSNINPVALSLLNFKLPDGSFLIPTPQSVNPTKPFASQGFSAFSQPCHFQEDQFTTNADYVFSAKNKLSGRFFFADDNMNVTFPGGAVNQAGNISGFPSQVATGYRVLSISDIYSFTNKSVNEARFGYVRTSASTVPSTPFKWSDVGVTESGMNENNQLPALSILGSVSFTPSFPRTIIQNNFVLEDELSFVRGNHIIQLGGSLTRVQDNLNIVGIGSFVQFLSWPDFLLGLDATDNGTEKFSNVFASIDSFGLLNREYRAWEGSAFVQDDYRASRSLTLNLGLRYERLGQFADELDRNSSFDISRADANPPAQGSTAGYVVASNFHGEVPAGVIRADNQFANDADGQNTFGPRVGFAWQVFPNLGSFTVRGGYGLYYSRPTGQAFFQNVFSPPFALSRNSSGLANANATFQIPFAQPFPTESSFPGFPAYSPSTLMSLNTVSPDFRTAVIQQYGLNIQTALRPNFLLEVGYVGTRGTHLLRLRSSNQALAASPEDPIRGVTVNTLANVASRVPIEGFAPAGLLLVESEGESWYNGLEISLTKRMSYGLQFLASYTFSKTLDTDGANINTTSSGNAITLGDQNDPNERRGPTSFNRPHRFIFSTVYTFPGVGRGLERAFSSGWVVASVVTIQSGSALTISYINSNNVFGITQDRAQLASGCSKNGLVTTGSIESKLNNYFNLSCFKKPAIIGADGIGTAFGNSGTGIVSGPAQFNVDLSLSKMIEMNWLREGSSLQIRSEFFNALNHPQFSLPNTNYSSSSFGVIQSTAVNPRIIQLALKFTF